MALSHILKTYPQPEKPHIYTGLFTKRLSCRNWSDKPNKCKHGVSYTQYDDAMDVQFGKVTLFDLFHGRCWDYAKHFKEHHTGWEIVSLMRGNWADTIVHTFCIKNGDESILFADARGITDDPTEFFSDFVFGKDAYLKDEDDNESSDDLANECRQAMTYTQTLHNIGLC